MNNECCYRYKSLLIGKNEHIADWLLNHPNKTEEGIWLSGTGNWNNWIETTSLAVLALLQVGIDKDNPEITKAIKILYSHKDEWTKDGKQIDGVTALQAYTNAGGELKNVYNEISYFSDWILNSLWNTDDKSHLELLKQSCMYLFSDCCVIALAKVTPSNPSSN